jgi:hypothetical protein
MRGEFHACVSAAPTQADWQRRFDVQGQSHEGADQPMLSGKLPGLGQGLPVHTQDCRDAICFKVRPRLLQVWNFRRGPTQRSTFTDVKGGGSFERGGYDNPIHFGIRRPPCARFSTASRTAASSHGSVFCLHRLLPSISSPAALMESIILAYAD